MEETRGKETEEKEKKINLTEVKKKERVKKREKEKGRQKEIEKKEKGNWKQRLKEGETQEEMVNELKNQNVNVATFENLDASFMHFFRTRNHKQAVIA